MFRLCFPDPDNVMDNVMDNAMDNVMESTDEESEEEPIQVHVAVPEDEDPAQPVLLPQLLSRYQLNQWHHWCQSHQCHQRRL